MPQQSQRLGDHADTGDQLDAQLAQAQGLQQGQLFVEAVKQVLGGLPVVLLPAASAGHEVFVESAPQAQGGGGDVMVGQPAGAVLLNLGGIDQSGVGLAVRQQNHTRKGVALAASELSGTMLPTCEQVGAAAAGDTR
jgi:hypothetical protein